MSTETQTFESIRKLRDALPSLPDDAVILDRDGDKVRRSDVRIVFGNYAPYTVRYESTTPAPLDPSKVRAGDTVTLLVDPPDTHPAFTVAGETHSLGGPTVYLGGWRVDDLPDYVTLTAHQPAPEPEPELPTLPVATGSLILDAKHDMRYFRANGLDYPWVSETGTWHDDGYARRLPDVRPLVVIDPAAVDVDALIRAVEDSPQVQGWRHVVISLLAELGIEATS